MNRLALVVVVLAACDGKSDLPVKSDKPQKPWDKLVESTQPLEAIGFTFDRATGVKVSEAFAPGVSNDFTKEVQIHGPTGYLGRCVTMNIPSRFDTIATYIEEMHGGHTIKKQDVLPAGFFVEFLEKQDTERSDPRMAAHVRSPTGQIDCTLTPETKELEVARGILRSLRPTTVANPAR